MNPVNDQKRDLVLHPGEYAYMQDQTRGQIKTHVGPTVINQTAQELPVSYDQVNRTFVRCLLEEAIRRAPMASEGEYIILENPAQDNSKPEEGSSRPSPNLRTGCKVNIPGPAQFALWPSQRATVVMGHHLRSNQYLLVRIYNEGEAKQNWRNAVAVKTTSGGTDAVTTHEVDSLGLTIGKLLIIKGTEVSFYIPPTGVEVISDEQGNYIGEAVTLERLEYSILVDEDGNKRFEKGPQVVFPKPTETFLVNNKDKSRKFKAIELGKKIQGLHIKVIADYKEDETQYTVGDELFITGDDTPIYYPRVEHSIIRYGTRDKHYATAIPMGEGRYVMNRETGVIKTEIGPKMLLPDPRREVIIRRILTDKQVGLWYPGNAEALDYNRRLREMAANAIGAGASNRPGFVSEDEVLKSVAAASPAPPITASFAPDVSGGPGPFRSPSGSLASGSLGAHRTTGSGGGFNMGSGYFGGSQLSSYSPNEGTAVVGGTDTFERSTTYQQPRTVTLDTKYEGVPSVSVYTGYAVMVVSKTGERRVVKGPSTILLNYDESLEILELSTGKPKNTDNLEKTVYLRVMNNKVSDIVSIRTKDHVEVSLKLSYRVNFEGNDPSKWFEVENYVKFLCDHVRSVLKGSCQKRLVEEFYANGVDIVRDIIIGAASPEGVRKGMSFSENEMRVTDVEVLGIDVVDRSISEMLNKAQHEVVRSNIELHQSEKQLEVSSRQELIKRQQALEAAETKRAAMGFERENVEHQQRLDVAKIHAELDRAIEQKKADSAREEVKDLIAQAELRRALSRAEQDGSIEKSKQDLKLVGLAAETDATVKRFTSATGNFSDALLALRNQDTLVKVAEAMSIQRVIGGDNIVDAIKKMFQGSGLDGAVGTMLARRNHEDE